VRALRGLLGEKSVRVLTPVTKRTPGTGDSGALSAGSKLGVAVRALAHSLRWRPRLVLCTHVGFALLGRLLGLFCGCPYWVSAHGIEVWVQLPGWKRAALRHANRVLSVSEFTRGVLLQRHSLERERVLVFPNVLDERLRNTSPDEVVSSKLRDCGRPLLLTVGRLSATEQYKGHDVVLRVLPRVLERFPAATYVIVGDGKDRPRLEDLARDLHVADRVFFAGWQDDAGLAACYRSCDIFVLPARTLLGDTAAKGEGFGIVFLEAMSFGKPVVGPSDGAPTEFIRDAENGLLVDPENPVEVGDAIIRLLENPEWAAKLGDAGRQLVERDYTTGATVRRLEELLSSLAGKK
jgi:phosphatidylinositol alpha-1,6-mannosyltransferase